MEFQGFPGLGAVHHFVSWHADSSSGIHAGTNEENPPNCPIEHTDHGTGTLPFGKSATSKVNETTRRLSEISDRHEVVSV